MPHISVKLYPGRTDDEKRSIAEKIRDFLAEEMQMETKYFSVAVEEIAKDKWQEEVVKRINEKELFVKADF